MTASNLGGGQGQGPYASEIEFLHDQLIELDLLLLRFAIETRQIAGGAPSQRGLFVSDEEFTQLLGRVPCQPIWATSLTQEPSERVAELSRMLATHRAGTDSRLEITFSKGQVPRLVSLARQLNLTLFDHRVLLMAIAAELDLRYERIFGWIHDDLTRQHPSVQLALDLFAPGLGPRFEAIERLSSGPLVRNKLITVRDVGKQNPMLRREILLGRGIVSWFGGGRVSLSEFDCTSVFEPNPEEPESLLLDATQRILLERLGSSHTDGLFYLRGTTGSGRRSLARAICGLRGVPIVVVDGHRACRLPDPQFHALLATLQCSQFLDSSAILWTEVDSIKGRELATRRPAIFKMARQHGLMFWTGRATIHDSEFDPHGLPLFEEIHLSAPQREQRAALWKRELGEQVPDSAHQTVTNVFRFTPGKIHAASASAWLSARSRGVEIPSESDVLQAARRHATPRLGELAQAVNTPHGWGELMLPTTQKNQLHEIVRRQRQKGTVLEKWGFGRKMVAREVSQDLYRIDLSQVVSKYIGETEKHLEKVFAEAEAADAALLFDEADALFGKRGEIQAADDRYANIEVGYLLQRIEAFPGLMILATNLRRNMDQAFLRRLQVIVEFPLPDQASRAQIWASIWPSQAPIAANVNPGVLAERFAL
ncbi:MAG: ATP-binding protein, partial [Nannocystaceae bacterium]